MPEESNAASSSRLDRIELTVELLAKNVTILHDKVNTLTEKVSTLSDKVDILHNDVSVLADNQDRIDQDVRIMLKAQVVMGDEIRQGFARLTEAQQHTDERLNALIAVVDAIVRRPPPPAA